MFSGRLPTLEPNRLGLALDVLRRDGVPLIDLTESNPTRVGLAYPPGLVAPLGDAAGLAYEPDPRGLRTAREAIALDLLRHGLDVDPPHLVLAASTSEAYAFLFKLLCNPGDHVLVPAPSYPLFDHLTRLDAVEAVPYALDPHGDWCVDPHAVLRLVSPRTRAVLVVSPNNPTGSVLRRGQLDALSAMCRDHGLALIGDEVFTDYRFADPPGRPAAAGPPVSVLAQAECLAFSLGGLSKSIGMPQLKLAWMAVGGPSALVREALARLDLIADTYLSVSTLVQQALPGLLEEGRRVRAAIAARLTSNLQALRRAVARSPACSVVEPAGGWSAVVRIPAHEPEEACVLAMLERDRVLVTPGYFYDFPFEAFVVVSLLVAPDAFTAGVERLMDSVAARGHA